MDQHCGKLDLFIFFLPTWETSTIREHRCNNNSNEVETSSGMLKLLQFLEKKNQKKKVEALRWNRELWKIRFKCDRPHSERTNHCITCVALVGVTVVFDWSILLHRNCSRWFFLTSGWLYICWVVTSSRHAWPDPTIYSALTTHALRRWQR